MEFLNSFDAPECVSFNCTCAYAVANMRAVACAELRIFMCLVIGYF